MRHDACLTHITLQTGDVHESSRPEADDEAVRAAHGALFGALRASGGHVPVPAFEDFTITAGADRDAAIVTIWLGEGKGGRAPVATVGISAAGGLGAGELWRVLHAPSFMKFATLPELVPPAPWCASRMDPGLALAPRAAEWLGDFARCTAWAWIEYRAGVT